VTAKHLLPTRESCPSPSAVRILQLTDSHCSSDPGQRVLGQDTRRTFSNVIRAILDSDVRYDFVLLTGDLAEDPVEEAYGFLREQLRLLKIPCYCLPGNHDDVGTMSRFLIGDNIRMESRIILDHWQIVCLDSTVPGESGGFLDDAQIELLQDAIASEPHKYLLVAVHHHPVPCESTWMDTMMIRNSQHLFAALDRFSAMARGVIFGHIHQTLDLTVRGVRFLGSPSTCCQFKPLSERFAIAPQPPGYRWIEITETGDMFTGVRAVGKPTRVSWRTASVTP